MVPDRIYSYDFLKIVATVLIVFHHWQEFTQTNFEAGINFFGGRFYVGYLVELFFIISGLVIHRYEEIIRSGCTFLEFYGKRMIRLIPMTTITAFAYGTAIVIFRKYTSLEWVYLGTDLSLWGIITSAIGIQRGWCVQDFGVNDTMWYVSILLLCYIIFYILNYFAKKCQCHVVYLYVLMIFVGVSICSFYPKYQLEFPLVNQFAGRGYSAFFTGCILGEALKHKNKWRPVEYLISVTVVFLFVYLTLFHYHFVENGFSLILTFIVYPSVIYFFSTPFVTRVLNFRIFAKVEEIAFHVYVWHLTLICAFVTVAYVLGYYHLIHTPFYMVGFTIVAFAWGMISKRVTEPIQGRLYSIFEQVKEEVKNE